MQIESHTDSRMGRKMDQQTEFSFLAGQPCPTRPLVSKLFHQLKRTLLLSLGLVSLGAFTAVGAQAHIEPKPALVKAGAKVVVSFTVEHGCGTSPTTKLQIRIPSGVKVANPTGPKSMVTSISGDVVTFEGAAPGKNRKVFLTVEFPKSPGVVVFPIVQTCKVGKESWIQVPNAADPKPNFPAPQITVK
jgi:periplasmic copper chaperone A